MTLLRKRDVEELMARYEHDPLAALTTALRTVLDQPNADWGVLLLAAGFSERRRRNLELLDSTSCEPSRPFRD